MSSQYIVVERSEDWDPFYPSDNLVTFEEYIAQDPSPDRPAQVINLCREYKYMGRGYYCSLLAEARGDRVLPAVRTINELSRRTMYTPGLSALEKMIQRKKNSFATDGSERVQLLVFFGTTPLSDLSTMARQVFELFPCPIIELSFRQAGGTWTVESIRPVPLHRLTNGQQDEFAHALDRFSRHIWRRTRRRRRYAYDLALLVNPDESLPPSNRKALENFVTAGRGINIDTERIGLGDLARLTEYDGLFIRETTTVDHHTYQFAQKAEFLHIPVVDDTSSIIRCANKVYCAELMRDHGLETPNTIILQRDRPDMLAAAGEELGFPLVLKIPDGAFSRGVFRIDSEEELRIQSHRLFQSSVLVLAQEFMYTDFDWRIGVLGGHPLFACKYFMSEGHWQIYNHSASGSRRSGGFATLAIEQVPAEAVKLAVKGAKLIGNGLYGVDIKQSGDRFAIIEINDNPNIDAGVEDAHLGRLLYYRVMEYLFQAMEQSRYGS